MPPQNSFELFSTHLKTVAETWEPIPSDRVHSSFGYKTMANNALDLLQAQSPKVPEKLTSNGVYHGARVIGQYCHIAALVSNREGYSKAGLVQMLEHPTSFEQLAMIARQPNTIAGDLEVTYGLGTNNEGPLSLKPYLQDYQGTPESGMMIPTLLAEIIGAREWLTANDEKRMCPAHKLGQLSKIYSEFIKICTKDPLLFDTTLRNGVRKPTVTRLS